MPLHASLIFKNGDEYLCFYQPALTAFMKQQYRENLANTFQQIQIPIFKFVFLPS